MIHCCEELANKLGKGNSYPKPAYISPEDWRRNGRLGWWYPGADGPGYYFIHELDEVVEIPTPEGPVIAPALEFRRMEECPYCGHKKRRPVGRPPAKRKMESIHLSLYPDQIDYLRKIGRGSRSRGARLIIEEAIEAAGIKPRQ
jgi:hypothetical protein